MPLTLLVLYQSMRRVAGLHQMVVLAIGFRSWVTNTVFCLQSAVPRLCFGAACEVVSGYCLWESKVNVYNGVYNRMAISPIKSIKSRIYNA